MVNNDFSRADEPTVEWLFDPPRHLSFPGTFQECRTLAKQEKKWILVNIQSHEEFASHQLNRDTWTDETVQEILRENFVFWQRGHTSLDAKNYSTLYHINENDLPHIGIIDPRTGSKTSTIKGYMEPRILTQTLFEYFDEHSLDSTKAGKQRTTIVNSSMGSSDKAVVIDDDDDDFDYKAEYKVTEDVRDSRVHPQDKADERETKKPRDESASDAKSSKLTAPKMDYGPVEDEPGLLSTQL
jgi:thioredoxin-related protein